MQTNNNLIRKDLWKLLNRLKALTVTKTWRGYGATLFVEFGDLDDTSRGELTVTIEGLWQLKENGKLLVSGEQKNWKKIATAISCLVGKRLTDMAAQNDTHFHFTPGSYELEVAKDPSTPKTKPGFKWAIHANGEVDFIGGSVAEIKKEKWG